MERKTEERREEIARRGWERIIVNIERSKFWAHKHNAGAKGFSEKALWQIAFELDDPYTKTFLSNMYGEQWIATLHDHFSTAERRFLMAHHSEGTPKVEMEKIDMECRRVETRQKIESYFFKGLK